MVTDRKIFENVIFDLIPFFLFYHFIKILLSKELIAKNSLADLEMEAKKLECFMFLVESTIGISLLFSMLPWTTFMILNEYNGWQIIMYLG